VSAGSSRAKASMRSGGANSRSTSRNDRSPAALPSASIQCIRSTGGPPPSSIRATAGRGAGPGARAPDQTPSLFLDVFSAPLKMDPTRWKRGDTDAEDDQALEAGRGERIRTSDILLPNSRNAIAADCRDSQAFANTQESGIDPVHPSQPFRENIKNFSPF